MEKPTQNNFREVLELALVDIKKANDRIKEFESAGGVPTLSDKEIHAFIIARTDVRRAEVAVKSCLRQLTPKSGGSENG
jgi:hypothetical protein